MKISGESAAQLPERSYLLFCEHAASCGELVMLLAEGVFEQSGSWVKILLVLPQSRFQFRHAW